MSCVFLSRCLLRTRNQIEDHPSGKTRTEFQNGANAKKRQQRGHLWLTSHESLHPKVCQSKPQVKDVFTNHEGITFFVDNKNGQIKILRRDERQVEFCVNDQDSDKKTLLYEVGVGDGGDGCCERTIRNGLRNFGTKIKCEPKLIPYSSEFCTTPRKDFGTRKSALPFLLAARVDAGDHLQKKDKEATSVGPEPRVDVRLDSCVPRNFERWSDDEVDT
ncbi:hypothetical protein NPIL_216041 [Nephila pilipes]|uniref:Uncharacterized protein n=1 Tax=Nephila pilipes TaxID=299642 RepID=A0A8X6NFI0_NEPPI|nr:hypothetical protein NPIL_216041 [Nephila pilipes]